MRSTTFLPNNLNGELSMQRNWKLICHSRNVHEIRWPKAKNSETCHVLLISDVHWDNPHCDRRKLEEDCDEAVKRGAPIISIGDFFCAMQGKYDKRSSKDNIRPEHMHGDYFDSLVSTAADWHQRYKHNFAIHGLGNHETSIKSHHETDLIERLTSRIQERGGITQPGGYGGWVVFKLIKNGKVFPIKLYYHHGFGGGGPVTRGTIDWSRYLMHAEADIYAAGHIHYLNSDVLIRAGLTSGNNIQKRKVSFVRCSTYKDEYDDGHSGFHVEKGRGPRPIGGYWLNLHLVNHVTHGTNVAVSVTETV